MAFVLHRAAARKTVGRWHEPEREATPRVDGLAGGADLRRRDGVLDAIDVRAPWGGARADRGGRAEGGGDRQKGEDAHGCFEACGERGC